MDLRDKLKWLEQTPVSKQKFVTGQDIGYYLDGEEIVNERGRFFRYRKIYPAVYSHGRYTLDMIWNTDSSVFSRVGKDNLLEKIDFKKALFIDTETTGLAGGTGTVPFLVGIGYFVKDGFCVDQLFIRDYHEEPALLYALQEMLSNYHFLVSYNGKAYDINLLTTRFTLARMKVPVHEMPHLDLLHTARRLWRKRISDCSLGHVESRILEFNRLNDVAGYLIPGLYFEYLHTRDAEPLLPVFRHNQWDILSLLVLAALTGEIYRDPASYLNHPYDLFSLGRSYENFCDQDAAACYEMALTYPVSTDDREMILCFLGFVLKRMGRWERAVAVWQEIIQIMPDQIYAYEELAKYYEHRSTQINKAIYVVERALERIELSTALRPDLTSNTDLRDLKYRLARLKRKQKKLNA